VGIEAVFLILYTGIKEHPCLIWIALVKFSVSYSEVIFFWLLSGADLDSSHQ